VLGVSTYQIAQVAERTGFTPATLRYYEDIGLMAPAQRTPAGYRLYNDASLARLEFVARAKQLGCSLDEITDLARAWDGGECGPVLHRLRAVVDEKIAGTQARIAELTAFATELQRAAAGLRRHQPEGRCGQSCACVTDPAGPTDAIGPAATVGLMRSTRSVDSAGPVDSAEIRDTATSAAATPVPLVAKADAAAEPIACALDADDLAGRLEEWTAVLDGVTTRLPLEHGVRLELAGGTDVAEVARLAAAEQDCCRFFRFAVVIDHRGVALEVQAPPDAADLVTAVFGAP
jgi:MerR family copper efflux transcriptional regulator